MTERPNFCSNCGAPIEAGSRFCARCGKAVAVPTAQPSQPTYPPPVQPYPQARPVSPPPQPYQQAGPGQPPVYQQPYPQARPVPPPPQPYQQAGPGQPPVYQQPYPQPYARPRRPTRRLSWLAVAGIVLGILLLLALAARLTALKLVGQTTIATVTAVEGTDRENYEYRVEYVFAAPNGDRVSGATVLGNVLDTSRLPSVGDQVTVRFLPFWPAINELEQ
jgi:hypothetical protein